MKQKKKAEECTKKANLKIKEGRFMVAAAASTSGSNLLGVKNADTSGDAACALHLPDGKLAFILSDGMGKGLEASAESKLVVQELRKLLKKGVPPSRAIKLVNKVLIGESNKPVNKGHKNESFATVDLTMIDKVTGVARLYKMGAASSFLVRNKSVKKIEQAALPVGIIKGIKATQTKMQLQAGDTLVIVSDGITEADRKDLEARWLQEYLANAPKSIGPKIMANEIASIAQSKYRNRAKDDITVIVIQAK